MSFGAFAELLGMILGGVLAVLAAGLLLLWLVTRLDASLAGVPKVRAALVARGVDPRIAERISHELEITSGGVGCGAFVGVLGLGALSAGGYVLVGMHRPEPEEVLLYPAPGIALLLVAVVIFVRARRVDPDTSALYKHLVTGGPRVRVLVRALVPLRVDVTTAADALVRHRVTQMQLVPHVIVVHDDGTELAIRALDDTDVTLRDTVRALQTVVPHARPSDDVLTDYVAGSGRALLAA